MSWHHHDGVDLVQVSADYAKNGVNYSEKHIITLVSGYVNKPGKINVMTSRNCSIIKALNFRTKPPCYNVIKLFEV